MKINNLVTIVSLLMIGLFAGCEKDDYQETIGICPLVVSTDPADGDTNVFLDKVITVTFNEEMNPATLNAGSITIEGQSEITGTITYDQSTLTASFTPSELLTSSTTYAGRVKTTVKDLDGNALQEDYVWTFSTGENIAPMVIATDPETDETDVVINKIITATFNQPMNPQTMNETTFIVMQGGTAVTGAITYTGTTVSFAPTVELDLNTVYTATITAETENTTGIALQSDYIWEFTTGALVAPTVIATDPENDETDVALNKVIRATFSEPMDVTTINGTTFTLNEGTNVITGVVTYSGTTASFTPSANLTANTTYTANITAGAENVAGISLAGDYSWKFTTGAFIAPTVISTDPEDEETGVALDIVIDATFSEPMDAATINTTTFTLTEGTNTITGLITYTGTTASFDPNGELDPNTLYTATITAGAENIAGIGLENVYIWSFTTLSATVQLPDIGTLEFFGGFGGNAGLTNEGLNTVINNGGIGTTAASTLVTGFEDGLTGDIYTQTPLNEGLVTGGIFTAPPAPGTATSMAIAEQALLDAQALYNAISPAAMPGGTDPGDGELGGLTLAPGVYQSASGTFNISTGDLTLDAQGDPNALWVFQTASGLTVGIAGPTGAKNVNIINGGDAANVFWQVGSAATINAAGGGTMTGTIVSMAGVTLSTAGNAAQTVLNGRAISLVASVTMVNTTINVPN